MRITFGNLFRGTIGLAVALNAASWLMVYFMIPASGAPFVIRYQWIGGGDLFGMRSMLFVGPAIGLIICLINAMLASSIAGRERAFALLVAGMTVALEIAVLLYAWTLVNVNTF